MHILYSPTIGTLILPIKLPGTEVKIDSWISEWLVLDMVLQPFILLFFFNLEFCSFSRVMWRSPTNNFGRTPLFLKDKLIVIQ